MIFWFRMIGLLTLWMIVHDLYQRGGVALLLAIVLIPILLLLMPGWLRMRRRNLRCGSPHSTGNPCERATTDQRSELNMSTEADRIEAAHDALGHTLGWRFLTCPEKNFEGAKLLLVTLNPAGNRRHGPSWSQESGSAYVVESWNGQQPGADPLQRQIQKLFAFLGYTAKDVASAHFIPFRSPRWADLGNKKQSIAFARGLWTELLQRVRPAVVVCVGHETGRQLASLVGISLRPMPTGWGAYTLLRGDLPGGRPFVALPHLSTFKLFGSAKYEPFLRDAFE